MPENQQLTATKKQFRPNARIFKTFESNGKKQAGLLAHLR